MKKIPAELVRKNNSNVYACDDEFRTLFRALRRERFSKERLEGYYHYCVVSGSGVVNPYPEVDFRMDLDKFLSTLNEDNKAVFMLFMKGFSPKEISERTKWSRSHIYYKLKLIFNLFKKFYKE